MNARTQKWMAAAAWLATLHLLLLYGLPEALYVTLALASLVFYWRSGPLAATATTLGLAGVTLLYAVGLQITGYEDRIYYRPDEKYMEYSAGMNHRRYEPRVRVDFHMPYGDLHAMAGGGVAEPRRTRFETDSDGFRNSEDYHGQKLVLVGDSFVAGSGNSQEDLLGEQLKRDFGIDTYSLGCPGNLAAYAAYIDGFRQRYGSGFRVLLFIFEGNDFENSVVARTSAWVRYGRAYYRMFSKHATYRVTKSLIKRLTRRPKAGAASVVDQKDLAGKPVLFYRNYAAVTRREAPLELEGFADRLREMAPVIDRVYFIPTKTRVYGAHIGVPSLPDAQWSYLRQLCSQLGIRCRNLTADLVRESNRLLADGELTWWRDDTHWNRRGIAVAARVIAADYRDRPRPAR